MLKYDEAIERITNYVCDYKITSSEAYTLARACFFDALACAYLALNFKDCTKLLGPLVKDTVVPNGCRVPGTSFILDPVRASFNIGTLIRWLDYNDTWLGAEWAHPSDNLGGIIAISDWLRPNITFRDVLTALIKAYEIQGIIAIDNSFNKAGLDHVLLIKVATAATTAHLMGGTKEQISAAVSQAFIDLTSLRTYRHAPNTGSRKSWAAGDATARGVELALMSLKGEIGYPNALSAPKWGLYDVLFKGQPFHFQRDFGSYIVENILFKVYFPAEFHAQTAVEAAVKLFSQVKDRWQEIEKIHIETHKSALDIIDKRGPLLNPADRDHCLQYMVAVMLLYGFLEATHYENEAAKDPRLDALRDKMVLVENEKYSKDYHDPLKRSVANSLTIYMKDNQKFGPIEVEYPLGHPRRREEALPLLAEKFKSSLRSALNPFTIEKLLNFKESDRFDDLIFLLTKERGEH